MIQIKVSKTIAVFRLKKSERKELARMFTVSNPVYIDAKRMGRNLHGIERKLKLYSETKNKIDLPVGALEEVLEFLGDQKWKLTNITKEVPARIHFDGKLKPIQKKALKDVMGYDRGLLVAMTGAGKTVMGIAAIVERQQKTLIMVHTSDLADQWVERLINFTNLKEVEIGRIGNGKFRVGRMVTVALVQSLYQNPEDLRGIFGFVVVDECHRCPSRTFTEAMTFLNTRYRLGLTATPYRNDKLNSLIFWYIGPIRHTVSKKELIKLGAVLLPKFIMRETEFWSERSGVHDYVYLMQELCEDEKRNTFICDDIAQEYRETSDILLVLSDRKTHCAELARVLKENYEIESIVFTGDVNAGADRQAIIHKIGTEHRLIIATGQLIGEGFDCAALNQMFMTTPMKFKGRVTQYIGRVMRPAPGKSQPIVRDYADWEITVLAKSARERIKTYGGMDAVEFT